MGYLYLHIGTPKTGTTSIQYFLEDNQKIFLDKGYCFPDMGYEYFEIARKNRNAHFLFDCIYHTEDKQKYEKAKKERSEGIKKLIDYLDSYDNVILSDENVWIHFQKIENFWEELKDALEEHGHSIKVIVYLRRQDTYIRSYYTEMVKSLHQRRTFVDYINTDTPALIGSDYLSTVDLIASVIGQENVMVRPFERNQLLNGDLYADFLNCLGLSLTDEFNCTIPTRNETIAGEYIQVKQILNSNPDFARRRSFFRPLAEASMLHCEKKADYRRATLFPDNNPSQYLEQYEEGNKILAKKYLNREDGILFYEAPKSEEGLEPYTTEELVLTCGDLILELKRELDEAREEIEKLKKMHSSP